jgi:hypothetical protein
MYACFALLLSFGRIERKKERRKLKEQSKSHLKDSLRLVRNLRAPNFECAKKREQKIAKIGISQQ